VTHWSRWLEGGRPHAAIALAALAAVGAALVTQHGFGMLPCPWCVLQRMIFVVIALVALPAAAVAALRRPLAALTALLGAGGAAAALWQHFVAASSTSCKLTLADRIIAASRLDALLPSVFAPWASCADAAVRLLGLPYEAWSLALFIAIAAVAVAALLRSRR
jgi:disulfide bond formation protein DsbB